MAHHHDHTHLGRKLWLAILLNTFITIAQVVGGFFSGSLSLLSDALHNFSDVIALLLSYFAVHLGSKRSTPQKTFGYKRGEILAAFLNISGLLVIAFFLGKEAISRFFYPREVDSLTIIALGGLSVVINFVSVCLIHKEAKNSLNIRSAYLHLFSDILSSVAVCLGGVIIYWTQAYWVDSVLSMGVACYLLYTSWHILMDIIRIIMHFTPEHICLEDLEKELLSFQDIENVHHIHVWNLNDKDIHFEAHVDFVSDVSLSEASQIINRMSQRLHEKFGISHCVIQPEIGIHDSKTLIVTECHL